MADDDHSSRHSSETQVTVEDVAPAESVSTASEGTQGFGTYDYSSKKDVTGDEDREELEQKLHSLTVSSQEETKRLQEENAELVRKLAEAEKERHSFENQYKNLLGKVSTIRNTLGERLKSDTEEITRQKTSIEYLEQKCRNLTDTVTSLQQEVITASDESDKLSKELASLRQSSMASQDSWQRERSALLAKEKELQSKLSDAERSLDDWNVIANEEKTMRVTMSERVAELEEQVTSQRVLYDGLMHENTENGNLVRNLQHAISVQQEERKTELHEIVEKMQAQIDTLSEEKSVLSDTADDLKVRLESANADLEKMRPFEKEVKEKSLLIGKLRHEAVILNEHLTKALKLLRKGTPDESVDRQLITNLLLSFLTLPRSDTKRFEILQLIAACLSWNDEQKTMAGLMRSD
ncbi:hypothetical protein V1512DRAFT_212807 [Lipomyces arxii]|uniref:uncharacterized protein n=1 Tax=Lipomyces arxii TaxID=56418 RepID=UPI0034CF6E4C